MKTSPNIKLENGPHNKGIIKSPKQAFASLTLGAPVKKSLWLKEEG